MHLIFIDTRIGEITFWTISRDISIYIFPVLYQKFREFWGFGNFSSLGSFQLNVYIER